MQDHFTEKDLKTLDALLGDTTGHLFAETYSLAKEMYTNGLYAEAVQSFRLLVMAKNDNPFFWSGLGSSFQMLQDYNQALASYAMASLLDEKNPIIHYHAAECLFSIQQKEQGLAALNSAELACTGKNEYDDLKAKIVWLRDRWS